MESMKWLGTGRSGNNLTVDTGFRFEHVWSTRVWLVIIGRPDHGEVAVVCLCRRLGVAARVDFESKV